MSAYPTFSKPALAIIVVLLIVTGISLYFAISRSCCSIAHEKIKTDSTATSSTEPGLMARSSVGAPAWDTEPVRNSLADSCVLAYVDSNTCIKTDSDAVEVQLKGFSLNISKISMLLRDPNLVRLYLEFGVSPQYLDSNKEKQYVTLFVAGLNSDNEMMLDPTTSEYYRYEFIRPCPTHCPTK